MGGQINAPKNSGAGNKLDGDDDVKAKVRAMFGVKEDK